MATVFDTLLDALGKMQADAKAKREQQDIEYKDKQRYGASLPFGQSMGRTPGVQGPQLPAFTDTDTSVAMDYMEAGPAIGAVKKVAKKALSKAAPKALDMSEAARMARAKEMGFDTGTTWYHGTKADISNFDPNALGASTNAPSARRGFFFTKDPSTASDYSKLSKERAALRGVADYNTSFEKFNDSQRALFAKYGSDFHDFEAGSALLDNLNDNIRMHQESLAKMKPGVPLEKHFKELIANKQEEIRRTLDAHPKLRGALDDPLWKQNRKALAEMDAAKRMASDPRVEDPLGHALKNDSRMKDLDRKIDAAFEEYRAQPDAELGWSDQSWKTQNIYARARELEQQGRDLRDVIAKEIEYNGANVLPTNLKMQNPYVHDFKGQGYRDESYNNILKKAQEAGHDSVLLKNTYDPADSSNRKLIDVGVVFDPSQIRSKFAAFDPKKKGSGDISAGLAAAAGLGGLAASSEEARADEDTKKKRRIKALEE